MSISISHKAGLGLALLAAGTVSGAAHAQTELTSRTQVGGSNTIGWSQLGAAYSTFASPVTATSTSGITASVTDGGTLERRDQGNGWAGNYAANDPLLWNQDNGNPITFTFSQGLSAVGAQTASDPYGGFTATIKAFDKNGNLLSTFSENGTENGNQDNSAIFLGVKDATADIFSVQFSNNQSNQFSVNELSINPGAPVPEASTTVSFGLLLMLGLGGAVLAARKRKAGAAA